MSQCFRYLTLLAIALFTFAPAELTLAKSDKKPSGSAKKGGSATKNGFAPLFNGKDLSNWVQRGGTANYSVEGDTIVGTSKLGTPNSFLCTPRDYNDFVLELDFKVDDGLNSGIQIRSNSFEKETTAKYKNQDGKTISQKISANRVHGYQVEIDPSERSWSAGIYDESRRGWLNNLEGEKNKPAREAFKHNDWNHYRIEAIGDSIKTWINGVPAADLKDDLTAQGFIALQVHSIHDKKLVGKQVRWKNIMLKDIAK